MTREPEDIMWELEEQLGEIHNNFVLAVQGVATWVVQQDPQDLESYQYFVQDSASKLEGLKHVLVRLEENIRDQSELTGHMASTERRSSFRVGLSSDPSERAYERMDAAARRGGLQALITETMKRAKIAQNPAKLKGIVDVATDLIGDLEALKKFAVSKLRSFGVTR